MVPLRTRFADVVKGNRNIRMEHLYSFRAEGQRENRSRSIVENPSLTRLLPEMETNNEQLEKQGREQGRGVGTQAQHPENYGHWSLVCLC